MISLTHVTPEDLIVTIPVEPVQLLKPIKAWEADCPMCVERVLGWTADDTADRMSEHIRAVHDEELDQL